MFYEEDSYASDYRSAKRQIERMKKELLRHPNPNDPDCPEYTWDDIEEAERALEEII